MNEKQSLNEVLNEGPAPAADPHALKQIVGRRDRIVRWWAVLLAAIAVVVGMVGGAGALFMATGVETGSTTGPVEVATEAFDPPQRDMVGKPDIAPADMPKWNRLFVRGSDGVAVRAFEIPMPAASPPVFEGSREICTAVSFKSMVAQVSDDNMVGVVYGGTDRTPGPREMVMAGAEVVGVQESSPTAVVVTRTGAEVTTVRYATGSGRDEMAVNNGWAVLTRKVANASISGTVEALDKNGAVVSTVRLPQPQPAADTKGMDPNAATSSSPSCGGAEPMPMPAPMPTPIDNGGIGSPPNVGSEPVGPSIEKR